MSDPLCAVAPETATTKRHPGGKASVAKRRVGQKAYCERCPAVQHMIAVWSSEPPKVPTWLGLGLGLGSGLGLALTLTLTLAHPRVAGQLRPAVLPVLEAA